MSTVDALRGARALIEKQWCQGDAAQDRDYRYGFCAVSALGACTAGSGASYSLAYSALQTAIGDGSLNVMLWNDAPGRTKEDVLAAYDRAIIAAKEAA